MELNGILFPAPQSSYTYEQLQGQLLWIPAKQNKANIPCLFLSYHRNSSKLLIYFHGNAEDVGLAFDLLDHLRTSLMVHILAVEYPGYGVYRGQPNANRILQDVEDVFDFITDKLKWNSKNIILFGRSIGSGPACFLSAKKSPGSLLLMSPYTTIKSVVKHVAGKISSIFVKERFNNIELMPKITCPTFIVHGQLDTLIPYSQSQELHGICAGPSTLLLPKDMNHNDFDFYEDLTLPFSGFLIQCGISVVPMPGELGQLDFHPQLFEKPENEQQNLPPATTWQKILKYFKS